MKTLNSKYHDRIKTLRRRRDFLIRRVADYHGKSPSRDEAEASALDWAIALLELYPNQAIDLLRMEKETKGKERQDARY